MLRTLAETCTVQTVVSCEICEVIGTFSWLQKEYLCRIYSHSKFNLILQHLSPSSGCTLRRYVRIMYPICSN
jgi:hypothetical protein